MANPRAPSFRGLPVPARVYIGSVLALALAAVAAAVAVADDPTLDFALFAIAAVLCATGNLFEVFAPANFSFQPNLIVFLCGALLLPPWAVAVLAVLSFLPGWLAHRFRWYMVAFNIANYAIAGLAAHMIVRTAGNFGGHWSPDLASAVALAAAAVAFVTINHALIVAVVTLARGRSLRHSAEDMLGVMPMDLALAMTGACLAALWVTTPALALLACGPIVLIYRALWVPLLQHKSRTDPKTGLYNSEYLEKELEDSLASAKSGNRGLSVVMIDLDQLRLINNRHGHLAGDRLIRVVADAVSESATAHNGLAARFGGDELCVLLPDTGLDQAREIAEKMRARIEGIDVPFDDAGQHLSITASAGLAAYPEHAETAEGLLRVADAAVYDAKLGGRNRTRTALPPAARDALAIGAPQREPSLERFESTPEAAALRRGRMDAGPEPTEAPGSEPAEPAAGAANTRPIKAYIGLLCTATAVIGLLASRQAIADDVSLFVSLVAAVVLLDAIRIDVFERANLSPAAVPELALAFFFGPLGPITAEAAIAVGRLARRDPVLKWSFDFGALSLAGAAAAGAFSAFPYETGLALFGVAALAGTVYYLVNSALLAVVMGLAERRGPVGVWRERLAWMVPHYVVFGLLAAAFVVSERSLDMYAFVVFGLPMLMLWIAEKQYLDRSRATVSELRMSNDELEAANTRLRGLLADNQKLMGRMHHSYLSTITSLARTIEAKDPYTSGHTERVARIAVQLAAELGFDDSDLPAINTGAIIHDIGKIGMPDDILLKPGPLNAEELATMRSHTELSSYILAELELPQSVKQMARSHHERYDGAGYPDGLVGEEIPLAARILSVADALDAMTSDRPYRKALPLDVAQAEIQDKVGTQFCPRVVAALIELMDSSPEFRASFPQETPAPEAAGDDSEPVDLSLA